MMCCPIARVALAATLSLSFVAMAAPPVAGDEVKWVYEDFATIQKTAQSKKQRVFVYFWEDDNKDCVAFYGQSLEKDGVGAKLTNYLCVSAKKEEAVGKKLVEQYSISKFPSVLILNPDGSREAMLAGYRTKAAFAADIDKINSGVGTVSYYKKRCDEEPKDLERKLEYAKALAEVGETQQHDKLVAEIRAADPKGKTLTGAWFLYRDVVKAVEADADRDLKPMSAFLRKTKHKDIRFEGNCWMASVELGRDGREEALKAFRTAYSNCSKSNLVGFGDHLARVYWKVKSNLRTAEKKFVLKVAQDQAKLAESLEGGKTVGGAKYEGDDFKGWLAGKMDTLACCYYMAGRRKQAIEAAQKSIELAPGNKDFQQRLKDIEAGKL